MKHIAYMTVLVGFLALCGCASVKPGDATAARVDSKGPKMVLVENGVSRVPIIVFKDAPPYTRRAADELAGYIEKISGAKPEVIEGAPDPVPEHAIWVGVQPAVKVLFPKIDFDFKFPEEILIAADGKNVVIAGRDRWDPERLVVETPRATIDGKQLEYGTVNAVYTFLQDQLGVRWLWPGELGEVVPTQDTIAVAVGETRYHPQIRQRGGLFRLSALGDNRGISFDWTRFQRLQLDSLDVNCSHAFTTWWNTYHTNHPEYFALQPDGTRSGFPEPGKVKMCENNPSLWDQWVANVAEALNEDPDQNTFSASPNDSWNRGHCICDRCRAWDNPEGAPVTLVWQGLSQEYVSLSDRQVTFANTLGRLLKERFPGQDLYVTMHAYGDAYQRPPIAAVPADNVIMACVNNFLLRDNDEAKSYFAGWGKVAPHIIWRPNTGSAAGWQQGQPDVPLTKTMADFRFVAENHCIGLYVDTVWEYWPTEAPLYYLMAQMAWNPYADGQAILDDYYRKGFGAGADAIKAYWALLEEACTRRTNEGTAYSEVYDAALFARASGLLDRADTALADAPEVYRKRVAFVRAGLDYTRLMVETRTLMAQYRESEGSDTAAADKVRANWKVMEQIMDDNQMRHLKPGNRYSQGLHPDYR